MDSIHKRTASVGAALTLMAATAAGQSVTTFAGSGAAAFSDGKAAEAAFRYPRGIAVDVKGNVYVADTGNLRIRKISPGGVVTTIAGSGAQGYAGASSLPALAAPFWGPLGVGVDSAGVVWVADQDDGWDGQWLKKITTDGLLHDLTFAGLFPGAVPLAIVPAGADILDLDDAGLWRIPSGLGPATLVSNQTGGGRGLAVDATGTAYVADTFRHRIVKMSPAGAVTVLAGASQRIGDADGPADAATFNAPEGIAVDGSGRVFVADTGNHNIRLIAPDGTVTTIAGTGTAGRIDGIGRTASFAGPRGLALAPNGDLLVADAGNNVIRRIALGTGECAVNCTDWTVPSVARTPGPNGSFWSSDLTIHNRGTEPAPLTLKFLGHDVDGSDGPEREITVGPHQTVTYPDVLASVFGLGEGWGALQVRTPSDRIAVRSRTFALRAGGTVGSGVPGVRTDRLFTDRASPSPVLTGLAEDDRFRTNLVLVNGSASPIEVLVTATDSGGSAVGGRTYALRPFEMIQDSRFLARPEFGSGVKSDVTVTVSTPVAWGRFTVYAAVIDNLSNAPTTVLPQ